MSRIKLRSHLMTALRRNCILAAVVGLLSVAAADARPCRVEQLPNGSKFSCGNCHHSPYGGPRNAFGLAVEKEVARGSRAAFWSSVLAAKDSDGDGASNGVELGDPDGDGKPTVGAELTSPGNSKSKPTIPVEPVVPKLVIENPKFPFSLRFKTVKGQDYEVQSTADFQSWTTLAKIKGTGSEKVFADRRKALYPRQYYRVKLKE